MSYKRAPAFEDASQLARPFKVPFKTPTRHVRASRTRVNYNLGEEAPPEKPLTPLSLNKLDPEHSFDLIKTRFCSPLVEKPDVSDAPALGMTRKKDWVPRPLHDPCGEFAIVLYDPTVDTPEMLSQSQAMASQVEIIDLTSEPDDPEGEAEPEPEPEPEAEPLLKGATLSSLLGLDQPAPTKTQEVPVVIDPRLSKILRPHQVEGVRFLYRCTTGLVDPKANGCIMADEMGLGKTLQCIALMWTLLKQSPEGRRGTIEKCVIVCPSSLVRNWANELDKWLGKGAITPIAADGKSVKSTELAEILREWAQQTGRQLTRPVLIISYETLRLNAGNLADAEIGLLLADEGHRLKNGDSQTFTALDALNAKRRVILSGTPIQNDLSEYFSLLSFANPGLLGTRQEFRKNYEIAILRGRDAYATDQHVIEGQQKLEELLALVNKFIIRRTNDILSKYLPVKYEHVVFCDLTETQRTLYEAFINSKQVGKVLEGVGKQPLYAINVLKKLCNHPDLLDLSKELPGHSDVLPNYTPPRARGRRHGACSYYSGKFMVLERMLHRIRNDTNDKIVLISNYTQTLDLIQQLCRERRYGFCRLDGSMAISKRQKLVDRFNDPDGSEFIFLLSSKAGGCGINLIGANRLILLDPDWNPAADQQALARVWRDGQKKDCFVYRFISTGTIEEKIYQRQSMKQSLSSCVVDENTDVERLFSFDDLKRLFQLNCNTPCETHDTFKCKRCSGEGQKAGASAMLYGDATTWNHYVRSKLPAIEDKLLQQEAKEDVVSFVFQYISH